MATVYSLLCWGGYNGSALWSRSSNQLTKTNHGMRNAQGFYFSGGTLPTSSPQVDNATTMYYAKVISTSAIEVYTDSALTSQVTFSATGSGWVLKSQAVVDPATFFAFCGLSDLSRWDAGGGSYRIYDSIASWVSGRSGAASTNEEVCELAEAMTEYMTSSTLNLAVAVIRVESKVNGVRSGAFHAGVIGAGFKLQQTNGGASTNLKPAKNKTTVDGFTVEMVNGYYGGQPAIDLSAVSLCAARYMIVKPVSTTNGTGGIAVSGLGIVEYCLCIGQGNGFNFAAYASGWVQNCMAVKCTNGFNCVTYAPTNIYFYNNISLGNTTNWTATYSGMQDSTNNAGLSGEAWIGTGGSRVTIATTDFASWGGASWATTDDYHPALSSSPQVDAGITYYGVAAWDIAGDEVPNYNNGGSEVVDIGPFEFDHGYGPHPNTVPISITGIVDTSQLAITKQSDDSEIYNGAPGTSYSDPAYNTSVDIPVYLWLRKGSSATYYHPVKVAATISATSGLTYSFSGLQNEDIAAATYDAQIDTDWGINWSTGAITHDAGTTRYTVQGIYSMHQNESDSSTNVHTLPLMHGTTPTIFELINSGDISDADMEDLYGGSIEFPDGTLWTNLWTTDTMAAAHSVYVVQSGSKYTAFWGSGPIDVLLQVSDAGTLRDGGMVDVYAREYGYTYAYYQADLSAGGRVVAPLATLEDATTQTISSATAAGYTDVGYTFGSTSQDLGEGGGAGTYYCRIDCAGRTLDQVFARTMYDCRDVSTTTLNGAAGWKYRKAHSSYVANDAAPFGSYSGGFWNVAQGVWLDNVASADQYNYKLTDHAGTTHQLTLPVGAATATVLDGSRVVLYNTTQATEIDNVLMSGSTAYSYTITTEADTNDVLTLFVFKEGYEEASANMIWSGTTQSFVISQETHPYIAALRTELSITDYTTITEFAPDTTGHVYIEADDVDGSSQKARAAIWYNGILTTEGGARHFRGGMTILSTAAFRINADVVNMLFENVNPTTPLVFTDLTRRLYRSDGTSIIAPTSYSIHNDYSGVPDVVETGVSGLTGPESAQLMALPSASDIVTTAIDGTTTLAESLRLSNAVLGGKVSGAGTGTETFRDIADTVDRVVATVDSSGNRTAITLDLD